MPEKEESRKYVRMRRIFVSIVWAGLVLAMILPAGRTARAETVRIGVLPVLDALPLQVATQDGLFREQGLDVELVPFQSALERDMAAQAGRIDGYFGDLVAALLLLRSDVPMPALLVSYRTTPGHPMFALVTTPGRKGATLADLKGTSVGISTSTIIEFLLDRLEARHHLPRDYFRRVEIKKFPLRLQMLATGQIDLALLPEPLVSLNVLKGGSLAATDEDLNLPLTVVCLHERLRPQFPAFRAAYAEALERLTRDPESYRELMVRSCAIPAPLTTRFPVPPYPAPVPPTRAELDDVQDWMLDHGLLQARIPFERAVALAH